MEPHLKPLDLQLFKKYLENPEHHYYFDKSDGAQKNPSPPPYFRKGLWCNRMERCLCRLERHEFRRAASGS